MSKIPDKVINLTGRVYNKLEIISFVGINDRRQSMWLCKCECGNEIVRSANTVTRGNTTSCGCNVEESRKNRTDNYRNNMIGRKFNRLTVESFYSVINRYAFYNCSCDCGTKLVVGGRSLISGNRSSCGCHFKEMITKHGLSRHPLYMTWTGINNRCHNLRTKDYYLYGGRGISVCDEWRKSPIEFINWGMNNGYKPGLTIERIDNDGNYEPDNCKWATLTEQARNKITTKLTTERAKEIKNDDRNFGDIAEDYKVSLSTIYDIKMGRTWKDV